jgi:AraC-like DNA-binding protein
MVKAVAAIIAANNVDSNAGIATPQVNLAVIERSKEFIHTHFTDDFSLFDIAKHAFVSPFHFSRLFKMHTGQTPHQYVLAVRLKHSAMLLKNTGLAVSDVACQSGFANTDYFGYAFKKWAGLSPLSFRSS